MEECYHSTLQQNISFDSEREAIHSRCSKMSIVPSEIEIYLARLGGTCSIGTTV